MKIFLLTILINTATFGAMRSLFIHTSYIIKKEVKGKPNTIKNITWKFMTPPISEE